jgi:pimeloyl-ACP methyl ester carboxylesterase
VQPPQIRYARNGDVAIAYATLGAGPVDLVHVAASSNLEILWENPLLADFLRQLSEFSRVVVVDRRGTGLSDRYSVDDLPTLEELVDDLAAVLEDAGSDRPYLFGHSDAGSLCAMFAATRPDAVSGVILYATAARGTQAPDYPWQWTEEEWQAWLLGVRDSFGTRAWAAEVIAAFAPSLVGDEAMLDWVARWWRLSCSPSALLAQERAFRDTDIRSLLPAIAVPTLVLHRRDDMVEPVGQARYLAGEIPRAELVELPGADHWPWAGDRRSVVAEIERFVRTVGRSETGVFDRVLATILFTDIVDSTARAADLGDSTWRVRRERHDRIVRSQISRYRGREVKTMGDGFLAIFDGPARGVTCAAEIVRSVASLDLQLRCGVHTGEVELDGDDVSGLAVAVGARIGALAQPGEVLVSGTVKDLVVGSDLAFADRGEHELKGVPGAWRLHALQLDDRSPRA